MRIRDDLWTCGYCGDRLRLEDITGHLYAEGIQPPWHGVDGLRKALEDIARIARPQDYSEDPEMEDVEYDFDRIHRIAEEALERHTAPQHNATLTE